MRIVLQRVDRAGVWIDDEETGRIARGAVALVGVEPGDDGSTARRAAHRLAELRIFADRDGKMNLDAASCGAEFLVVSQFTLVADLSRGRRPSFATAARPEVAQPLIEDLAAALRATGLKVATGQFGAHMKVELVNDGPVTFVLEFE